MLSGQLCVVAVDFAASPTQCSQELEVFGLRLGS